MNVSDTEPTTIVFRQPAPLGSTFAQDAYASQVGRVIPVDVLGTRRQGTVLAANVLPGGHEAELTIEIKA